LEDRNLRKVSKEQAMDFYSNNNGINYWTECSAKKNFNIVETFKAFYKGKNSLLDIYNKMKNKMDEKTYQHSLSLQPKVVEKKCC